MYLNYQIEDKSWCYDNLDRNCDKYGRLYIYEAALEACPDGWHLPSDEEWKMLEMEIGMSRTEADKRAMIRGTIQGGRLKDNTTGLWEDPNNGAVNDIGRFDIAMNKISGMNSAQNPGRFSTDL